MEIVSERLPNLLKIIEWWEENPQKLPQHFVPDNIKPCSEEYKIFLFIFVFLTPRNNSKLLMDELLEILNSGVALEDLFVEFARRGKVPIMAKYKDWFHASLDDLGGFQNITSFEKWRTVDEFLDFRRRTNTFKGWGPKLYSLYRMTLEELCAISAPKDAFPVDGHITNMLIRLSVFNPGKEQTCIKSVEYFLRQEISRFLWERRIPAYKLHNPLWFLGSNRCALCLPFVRQCAFDFCDGPKSSSYWTGMLNRKK